MFKIKDKILSGSILSIAFTIVLSGCASKNPPLDKISSAESAINRASDNKAQIYAPLELKIAKEKVEKAKMLLKDKQYEEAAMIAKEAKVDAELAEEKSRTKETQKIAQEILDSINALKAEIERLKR